VVRFRWVAWSVNVSQRPITYLALCRYTSTSPKSFFTYMVLCMKMIMDEDGEKIVGDLTLGGDKVRKTDGPMM